MPRPLLFHYQPRTDILSRLPALSKFWGTLGFSLVVTQAPPWVLGPAALFLTGVWLVAKIPFSALWRPVPLLLVLSALNLTPLLQLLPLFQATPWFQTSPQSGLSVKVLLFHAGLQISRIALLLEAGHLLTTTTSPGQIAEVVRGLFRPWGRLRALQSAALVSLTIKAIPEILDRASQVKNAALLRGMKPTPSFILIKLWTIVLLRVLLTRGAETAQALELRGWGGNT